MSDTENHPLLDLLNMTGCSQMTNEINFSLFTNLKAALEADKLPTTPMDEVTVDLNTEICSSHDLWDKQDDLLIMMIKNYALSSTVDLFKKLNELSGQMDLLYVDIDGGLYGGSLTIAQLDIWVEEFDGDKDELQNVYNRWENVLNILDVDGLIKTFLETE